MVTRPPHQSRRSWRGIAVAIAIGLAVLVAFAAVDGLVRDPGTIPPLRIVNDTDDLVDVLVRTDDGSLLPIALVEARRSDVVHDVVDQGDDWIFVIQVSDQTVDRIRLTRDALERANWTVTIAPRA